MDPWVQRAAAEIAGHAERELEALVAVSSPSGDVHGAEECAAVCAALLPAEAVVERVPCSSAGHAPDLLARLSGTGRRRVLLLGHVDTVIPNDPPQAAAPRRGAAGRLGRGGHEGRRRAGHRRAARAGRPPGDFAEAALLLVCDEEWRTAPFAHVERFAGWDACLCFEAGELTADGRGGRRGAAQGRGHHPRPRARALRPLRLRARPRAQRAARPGRRRPGGRGPPCPRGPGPAHGGAHRAHSGDAFNVVPGSGELFCDLRADDDAAIHAVVDAIPREHDGVALEPDLNRLWPGMRSEAATGRCSPARRRRSGARSSACRAAGRATRATWPPPCP